MQMIKKYSLMFTVLLVIFSLFFQNDVVGYVLTLAIIFLLFGDEKNSLYFLIIYFPIRPVVIEMNPGMKFVGDLVIICLFFLLLYKKLAERDFEIKQYSFFLFFLGFCFVGTVAALISGVSLVAILFQLRAYLITLLLIFIVAESKLTKNDLQVFLLVTVLMASILSIHGLVEKISFRTMLLPETWKEWNLSSTNKIRVYGLIGNPNVLATYLIISFVSGIYLIRKNSFERLKWLLYFCMMLIFVTFLFTYSRGTLIAFAISAILYFVLKRDLPTLKVMLFPVLLSIPLIYYPTLTVSNYVQNVLEAEHHVENQKNGATKRYSEMFSHEIIQKSSEWGRLYIVKKGLQIFQDHPLIGTGFATFGDSATLTYSSPIYQEYQLSEGIYTDNQYIQILTETGVIGTILFVGFVFSLLFAIYKKTRGTNEWFVFCLFFIMAMIASAFYNMLEDKVFTLYFYVFAGYLLNGGVNLEKITKKIA